jgi:1-deoxy-D-xylulose-5-phosphate reductoisomerase
MSRTGVTLLGATGSIGRSALRVIERHSDRFRLVALTAHRNAAELDRLAGELEPELVVLSDGPEPGFTPSWTGEWRFGEDGLIEAVERPSADIVLNALVGVAGLGPTLRALEAGKRLALANKESLVAGGALVMEAQARGGGEILPVDSEHSAIHQCLGGRPTEEIRRLILTASGGPFRELPRAALAGVTPEDALAHPTWDMGAKITIDSATLANKALEVIEGHFLFGIPFEQISVVVHPSSIVHSMVEFRDGSTIAQMGLPTMEVPILYALAYPVRPEDGQAEFDPVTAGPLAFEPVREDVFPMFRLGVDAGRAGGVMPVVFNAVNEEAVAAFLDERVGFTELPELVRHTMECFEPEPVRTVDHVWEIDRAAREMARRAMAGRSLGTSSPAAGDSPRPIHVQTPREV